jgi:hypothetical protein
MSEGVWMAVKYSNRYMKAVIVGVFDDKAKAIDAMDRDYHKVNGKCSVEFIWGGKPMGRVFKVKPNKIIQCPI